MLAELAMAAAGALGGAVATDSWEQIKNGAVRLFRKGGTPAGMVEGWFADAETIAAADAGEAAMTLFCAQWSERFEDLLRARSDLAPDVSGFTEWAMTETARATQRAGTVQHVKGFDHTQQAVLGTGVQHNTFHSVED
ncbi:hypothetical protein [Actinomadura fibrosa]|uniref:Uncharacterized protein n=1 Tax=Actinomadura fibrosa TaxID=111802 RepID=A0ABW2XV50_9ACTN|nr:hypothetical protein [Actinomadura fibrosa]